MNEPEFRPGLADVPVAESAISFIDGQRARLEYRGVAVETLAKESCFEETAWLLLKGELPSQRELAAFDHDLRGRDPRWGLRRLAEVEAAASEAGLALEQRFQMPANNQVVVWRRIQEALRRP